MPIRKQLEVMLADAPGELAKLTAILKEEHVNIEAMSIQDANEYLLALYDVRSQTGRRVAPRDYYEAILKESATYSMIRLITDNPTKAVESLGKAGYQVVNNDPAAQGMPGKLDGPGEPVGIGALAYADPGEYQDHQGAQRQPVARFEQQSESLFSHGE